ncbi:MAG: LuxR C-terminal-related transcriptional regulator [Nocardioidaceae bacterium]
MISTSTLGQGREAFARQAWSDAHAELMAADRESSLEPADLERLAAAAHLIGRDDECADVLERTHQEYLHRGDAPGAARCAFWRALGLLLGGETARGNGWLNRGRRLLDEGQHDCVEQGYLLELANFGESDARTAHANSTRAIEIGERLGDPSLVAFARLGQAQALIQLGDTAEAAGLLDEIMVSVTAGEVSPIIAGIAYCAVIEACHETYDLDRAREWTVALARWCESQPQLVPYHGQCLVHRAEIMQWQGAWPDAVEAAQQAYERLHAGSDPAAGAASYRRGELHRLRGEFVAADESYREASRWGLDPRPGLALLRLAQGRTGAAVAAIRHTLDEADGRAARTRALPAYVEIMLAGQDVEAARSAADELMAVAADLETPLMRAIADQATGAVLLADGDPRRAHVALRHAWRTWRALRAPYEAARVRVQIAGAYRELGDHDSAAMELDAAHLAFRQLGAAPDEARAEQLSATALPTAVTGLTPRETEVLALVAAGLSNRAIGNELFLSEHTVARHVQHILRKLDVPSRTAAAAFAVKHDLV